MMSPCLNVENTMVRLDRGVKKLEDEKLREDEKMRGLKIFSFFSCVFD